MNHGALNGLARHAAHPRPTRPCAGGARCPADAGFTDLEPGYVLVGQNLVESERWNRGTVTPTGPLTISFYRHTSCCTWWDTATLGDPGVLQCGEVATLDGDWVKAALKAELRTRATPARAGVRLARYAYSMRPGSSSFG